MFKKWYLLMDKESGDGGSNAGGAGNGGSNNNMLGGSSASGTPAGDSSGGTPPGDPGKNGAAAASGDPGANAPSNDWRTSLPENMRENFKRFTSVEALAGSYMSLQKMVGGDKMAVPTKNFTDEDWNNTYRKLGLPEKVEDYAVQFKDGVTIDDKFSTAFRENAHKLGILPKQAQGLADWFSQVNLSAEAEVQAELKKQFDAGVAKLKAEWGNAFDLNIGRANKVLSEIGGKEVRDYFVSRGLGGDEQIVRLLAKVGETLYKEHKFVEGQGTGETLSPKELDTEIKKLQADPAYLTKEHPNHKAVVAEVQELFAKRYPTKVDKK